MNSFRKFSKKLVTLALAFTMLFGTTSVTASAATTDQKSYVVKTYKNGNYYTGTEYGAPITVSFDVAGDKIGNLKSSSDKLKVYVVKYKKYAKEAYIGAWSKTPGKYTVSFDILSATGAVKEHKSVPVKVEYYGTSGGAIKSVKYAGRELWTENFYDAVNMPKSGKVKVTLNKGYKLVGLRVGTRTKSGDYTYKKLKNGRKITLGTNTYTYNYKSDYSYRSQKDMQSYTYIEITYKDKKGNQSKVTYSLTKLINYVK